MGYNFYHKYQRFNPPNYQYTSKVKINTNHPNKTLLLDYYQAIENLNGYIITQWTTNDIDVRNPEDDDETTLAAVKKYNDKLGKVKFYESQLTATVKKIEEVSEEEIKKSLILDSFNNDPKENSLRLGEKSALVFEIQKLLNAKNQPIKIDGVFNTETFTALKNFEEQNSLYADGKLDALTLHYLLK